MEIETIIKGKKLKNALSTKSFIRTTLMEERWVIYSDAYQKWHVVDTETDNNDGGIFDYESDAQHFADCKNEKHNFVECDEWEKTCLYCGKFQN